MQRIVHGYRSEMGELSASYTTTVSVSAKMRKSFETTLEQNRDKLAAFASLLLSFNKRHNLISRRSEENVFLNHIVHSLAIASKRFHTSATIVDWGSGGGLPAIPLAIAEPSTNVVAVDAIDKKTRAVRSISTRLGIENIIAWNGRAEEWPDSCDYSVSRATAPLSTLWSWHLRVASRNERPEVCDIWRPGLLCLKGGDLKQEIAALLQENHDLVINVYDLASLDEHPYFHEKVLLHVYERPKGLK